MMKDQATPRPWVIKKTLTGYAIHSYKKYPLDNECRETKAKHHKYSNICQLAYTTINKEANARLIVKAVNSYDEVQETMRALQSTASDRMIYNIKLLAIKDELVEALKQAKSFIEGVTGEVPNIIKQALSRAESES